MNTNNEWYTPKYVIQKVKNVFDGQIDLDPCSTAEANKRIEAIKYFDKNDDCLTKNWNGKVFLNPPYSNPELRHVLSFGLNEFYLGRVSEMIILTNSGTDTNWNKLINYGLQAYTIGRIRFIQPNGTQAGTPGRGQVFTYFGDNKLKFIKEFTDDNFCWIPNSTCFREEL